MREEENLILSPVVNVKKNPNEKLIVELVYIVIIIIILI